MRKYPPNCELVHNFSSQKLLYSSQDHRKHFYLYKKGEGDVPDSIEKTLVHALCLWSPASDLSLWEHAIIPAGQDPTDQHSTNLHKHCCPVTPHVELSSTPRSHASSARRISSKHCLSVRTRRTADNHEGCSVDPL